MIGIGLFPLGEAVMGVNKLAWNRFPAGVRTAENKLWLNPDGMVTWIYEMTLGRSMGGAYGDSYTFAQAHPDLGEELWGYRHRAQIASNFTLIPKLMEEPKAWKRKSADSEENQWVVRMIVDKGSSPDTSADKDTNFRATPSQVRLVALNRYGDAMQCYPIGYFDHGAKFVPFILPNVDPNLPARQAIHRRRLHRGGHQGGRDSPARGRRLGL